MSSSGAIPRVSITAGRSTVLPIDFDIIRVAITNPAVADAVVVTPREILIDGISQGTISLIVWGDGRRVQYDISVDAPVTMLQQQLRNLFPGEDIRVTINEEATTLSGRVSSNAVMLWGRRDRRENLSEAESDQPVAGAWWNRHGRCCSRYVLPKSTGRRSLKPGVSLFTGVSGYKDFVGRSTTQQFAAPTFDTDKLTFSDFPESVRVQHESHNVGRLLKALQSRGFPEPG